MIQKLTTLIAMIVGLTSTSMSMSSTNLNDGFSTRNSIAELVFEQDIRMQVTYSKTLTAELSKAQNVIGDSGSWHEWVPFLSGTECEQPETGGSRICTLVGPEGSPINGFRMSEEILLNDRKNGIFKYKVVNPPFPVRDVVGTVKTSASSAGKVRLTWTLSFVSSDQATGEMVSEQVIEMYDTAASSLEKYLQKK